MFERLRSLVQTPGRRAVARRFESVEAPIQQEPSRRLQLLFFKLLMATAATDDSVTLEEQNLLKDFVFEHTLTEQEWAELAYYRAARLSREELGQLIDTVLSEIRTKADREHFLEAVRQMAQADDVLSGTEREILNLIGSRIDGAVTSPIAYVTKTLRLAWRRSLPLTPVVARLEREAEEYGRNPVLSLARRAGGTAIDDLHAARIGMALLVLHSDDTVHDHELEAFRAFVAREAGVAPDAAGRLVPQLLEIPDELLELTYLARTIVDGTTRDGRRAFLEVLAGLAHADGVRVFEEARTLQLIARYLFVPPPRAEVSAPPAGPPDHDRRKR
jgi:uncharacterized tellurite resistance protein B-like protein